MRKGLGRNLGKGYFNLLPMDRHVHSLSAKGIKSVNLQKYSGTWYSAGRLPTWFEKNCKQSKAEYKILDSGKVSVKNTCIKDGKDTTIKGTARSVSKDNKKLKVSFFPLVEGDYIIEHIDGNYEYAVVGHPDKDFLWILARDKRIPESKYQELLRIAKDKGYKTDDVVRTLNAKSKCMFARSNIKDPVVHVLSEKEFNQKFADDYTEYEVGYATTKIHPNGDVHVYLKDSGDYERNGLLLMHELKELDIWKDLVNKRCIDPNIADEMAHNMNPVDIEGVAEYYELDATN